MNFLLKGLQKIFNKHDIASVYGMVNEEDEYNPEIERIFVHLLKETDLKIHD